MFFSDALRDVWNSALDDSVPTGSIWEASVSGYPFLSRNDSFFQEAIQVCAPALFRFIQCLPRTG